MTWLKSTRPSYGYQGCDQHAWRQPGGRRGAEPTTPRLRRRCAFAGEGGEEAGEQGAAHGLAEVRQARGGREQLPRAHGPGVGRGVLPPELPEPRAPAVPERSQRVQIYTRHS